MKDVRYSTLSVKLIEMEGLPEAALFKWIGQLYEDTKLILFDIVVAIAGFIEHCTANIRDVCKLILCARSPCSINIERCSQ